MALATAGIAAVGTAVTGLVSGMVSGASQMEKYTVQLEVLLGSTKAAKDRIEELRTFANFTPFELPEVVEASKTLQVFTKGALATGEGLRLVGDIASGTGMQFGEAAMWMGRMYDALQTGRPIGEAAMRLQEVGALSGESRAKLEALAEAVKTGAKTGTQAWKEAAGEFSRYSGMMEKQSATLEGKMSTLSDAWNTALTKMGTLALPVLKAGVDGLTASVSLLDMVLTGATLPWSGKTWEGVPATLEGIAAGTDKVTNGLELNAAAWQTYANSVQNWSYIATGVDPVREKLTAGLQQSATIVRQTARDMADDMEATLRSAAPAIFSPLSTALGREGARLNALASQIPSDLATALLSDIRSWKEALNALNTVMVESMTRGEKVGFLMGALQSKAIRDGLVSGTPEIKRATQATAAGFINALVALQGPTWVAGYNWGNAAVKGLVQALDKINGIMGQAERAAWNALTPISPKKPPAVSGASAFDQYWKSLAGSIAGASRAVSSGGAAIESALDRAVRVAAERLAKLKALFDNFRSFLSTWPAMTADAITKSLDRTIKELAKIWKALSEMEKYAAIQAGGEAILAAEEQAKAPPEVQAVYAEIDAFSAQLAALIKRINDPKTSEASRKYLIALAAQISAEIERHKREAEELYQIFRDAEAAVAAQVAAAAEWEAANAAGTGGGGGDYDSGGGGYYDSGTGSGTTTYNIDMDVDFNGPTLDPYGDFATRLAAALIPGLQRELARQGISL
jgi:hypothetical protein